MKVFNGSSFYVSSNAKSGFKYNSMLTMSAMLIVTFRACRNYGYIQTQNLECNQLPLRVCRIARSKQEATSII